MGSNTKRNLFDHYAKSASAAGLHITDETLLCPLCWQGTKYGDLSLEHIVPSEVGGNRVVLTCTRCNNSHGSLYDAHLAQFQKTMDGFSGHGTIPAKLELLGNTRVLCVSIDSRKELLVRFDNDCQLRTWGTEHPEWSLWEHPNKNVSYENGRPTLEIDQSE